MSEKIIRHVVNKEQEGRGVKMLAWDTAGDARWSFVAKMENALSSEAST